MFTGVDKFVGILIGGSLIGNGVWMKQGLTKQAGYDMDSFGHIVSTMGWFIVGTTLALTNLHTSRFIPRNIPNIAAFVTCALILLVTTCKMDAPENKPNTAIYDFALGIAWFMLISTILLIKTKRSPDIVNHIRSLKFPIVLSILAYTAMVSSTICITPWEREQKITDSIGTSMSACAWILLAITNYL